VLKILKREILELTDTDQDVSDVKRYNPFTNLFTHTLDNLPQLSERVKALHSSKSKSDPTHNPSREISKSGDKDRTR